MKLNNLFLKQIRRVLQIAALAAFGGLFRVNAEPRFYALVLEWPK